MKTNRERRDQEEAKQRAERAKVYLKKFPQFKCHGDERFLDENWQLEQLRGFNEKCAPQK